MNTPDQQRFFADLTSPDTKARKAAIQTLVEFTCEEAAPLSWIIHKLCALPDHELGGWVDGPGSARLHIFREILDARPEWLNATEATTNYTPLMSAALHDRTDIFFLLLERGADLGIEYRYRYTVVDWLAGVDKDKKFAHELNRTPLLEHLLQANLVSGEQMGHTLNRALYQRNIPLAKLMLSHGAGDYLLSDERFHPVTRAVSNMDIEWIEEMRDLGVNFSFVEEYGYNALSYLADADDTEHSVKDIAKMAEILVQGGADPFHKDEIGQAPSDIAKDKRFFDTARVLEGVTQHKLLQRDTQRTGVVKRVNRL